MRKRKIKKQAFLNTLVVLVILLFCFEANGAEKQVYADSLRTGKTWALVVGISRYKNIKSLLFADNDAKAFYNYLVNTDGGPKIDKSQVKLFLNENALSEEIYGALDWLRESVKKNDRVVIYFSGHGDVEKNKSKQDGFLLAYNSPKAAYMTGGTVSIQYLQKYLKAYVKTNKVKDVMLIVDACRSGKLSGGDNGAQLTQHALRKNWNSKIVKILSAQENEISYEATKWGGGRGVFSYYLIKGLEGLANRDNDDVVTTAELAAYLFYAVGDATGNLQHPEIEGPEKEQLFPFSQKLLNAAKQQDNPAIKSLSLVSDGLADAHALPDTIQRDYKRYLEYVSNGRLIWGKNGKDTFNCALHAYNKLINEPGAKPIRTSLNSSLKAALQRKAQEILDNYLQGKYPTEYAVYEAAKEISYVSRLAGPGYVLYNYINARASFLQSKLLKDRNEAIGLMKKALGFEPNAAYAMNDIAAFYNELNKMDSAFYYVQKAIETAPKWFNPYNTNGVIYFARQDYDKAITNYQKAAELDPESPTPYYNIGSVNEQLHHWDEAMKNYQKAIRIDSSFARGYYGSAIVYQDMEDYDKAIIYYQKAAKLDSVSDYVKALFGNLGFIYYKKKSYDKAIINFQKALKLDSTYTDACVDLGSVYADLKEHDNAILYFKKAIKLDSTYALAYFNIGSINQNTNNFEQALTYYQKAIQLDSTYALSYFNTGTIYLQLKDYGKAILNCQKAISIDPKNADFYTNLGLACTYNKNYEKGIMWLQKAVSMNTENPANYYNLSCAYSLANETDKALEYLKQTIVKGFRDYNQFITDEDIINLRNSPEFNLLMKHYFPDKVK